MDQLAFQRLFGILAVFAEVGTLGIAGLWVAARFNESAKSAWISLKKSMGPGAPWLAFAVATTCMLGSLYFSEIAHLPPCRLCWYQRFCMYPLVLILAVAAIRKDVRIYRFAAAVAAIGMSISIYHVIYELIPSSLPTTCTESVPCSTVWFREFGYLSIPAMALSGFAFILALLAISVPTREEPSE